MSNPIVTIGLVQETASAPVAANVATAVTRIREAAGRGAQIICLQELFHALYFCKSHRLEAFDLAEPIPGPTVTTMQALARELAVAVIDADGALLGVYRKMHIPHDPLFYEKYYFAPGDAFGDKRAERHPGTDGFRVWKTRYADIGVLICWDQWYPEAARITALLGAEVLFYPTAIGWHPAERATFGDAQVEAWRTIQRAHAIANGVFVASPNRVGHEDEPGTDGLDFFGHSFVADPFGRVIAEAGDAPGIVLAACDRRAIEETRRNWPFLRDRRIDAYGGILNRYLG
jgi:N-carbamoylputrescine amidase